ncbi:MAG: PmoA family protein [Kiritimatiellae bacterium]|nr:PmoA family protein [Kiritimatiellia bacterium]
MYAGGAGARSDLVGRRGSGAFKGLAILQHPENPWYPSPWFTRDYGLLSPTPMYRLKMARQHS